MPEQTLPNYTSLTPVYVPVLCSAHLAAEDKLFHLGEGALYRSAPQAPHIHDSYEIGLILEGFGSFYVGNALHEFEAGQVYIINDLQPHMAYTADDCEIVRLFVVHFNPALITGSWITKMRSETWLPFTMDFNTDGPMIPLDDPVTPRLRSIIQQITDEADARHEAWEIVIGGLLIEAAGFLARRLMHNPGSASGDHKRRDALRRISPALQLIENRFADRLTLDEMADAVMVSRSHLCALFNTALGISPISYRNARRLAEGQHLLRSTDMTIYEIAYTVGFSSVQEFNRLFLKEVGVQPLQFRRQSSPAASEY
ncbi:MAG TPA: AraC family transcriptional regulator [Aggregatilineales bacterium]|nr:AraC family transcriptional regulator [Aggregatilineales bacterium]